MSLVSAAPPPPAVVAPADTFRALVKRAMRPRQQRILFLCTIAAFLGLTLGTPVLTWQHPCRALAASLALVAWVMLPVLLWRRSSLLHGTWRPEGAPVSRAAYTYHVLPGTPVSVHALVGALAVVLYAALCAPTLAVMQFVPAHRAHYVNETFIVALVGGTIMSGAYAVAAALCMRGARRGVPPSPVRFADARLYEHALTALATHVPQAVIGAAVLWPLCIAAYCLSRDTLWTMVLHVTGIDTPLRRWIVPSFRWTFRPWHLLVSTWPAVVLPVGLLEVAHTLFDVYWTHPLESITASYKDPMTALLGGLHDPHPFFSTHALIELARRARHDAAFRRVVFDDVQAGRPPALASMLHACVRALDAVAPPPAPAPMPPAPTTAAAAAPTRPRLWHTVSPAPSAPHTNVPPAPRPTPAALARTILRQAWSLLPPEARHVLFPRTLHWALWAPTPSLALDAQLASCVPRAFWAAEAAAAWMLASLTQDTYGVAQHHTAAVVDALARAHARLERVRTDVERRAIEADSEHVRDVAAWRGALADTGAAAAFGPSSAPFFTEMQASWQAYAPADAALSRALRQIVESFPT